MRAGIATPESLVTWMAPLAPLLLRTPAALIPGPMLLLAAGRGVPMAFLALGLLALATMLALALAGLVAARASRRALSTASAPPE